MNIYKEKITNELFIIIFINVSFIYYISNIYQISKRLFHNFNHEEYNTIQARGRRAGGEDVRWTVHNNFVVKTKNKALTN